MKPFAEAAEQNKWPIAEVLAEVLDKPALVLEIGSGTGQHAVFFTQRFPHLTWQPSELADKLPGIESWRADAGVANLLPALELDVTRRPWPVAQVDAAYSANTVHVMAWPLVEHLFAGVGAALHVGGRFCLYGPFHYGGEPTSDSNARFDLYLQQAYEGGGVRNFEDLDALAGQAGMRLFRDAEMPANNRLLVWEKFVG